jgi:glycosyltransferase involved in cell wall biosynthesis
MNVAITGAPLHRAEAVELSVVVPFYNESANVAPFFRRLEPVMDGLGARWEAICVNDGSSDDTFAQLAAQHQRRPGIKVIDFSRNFGKEAALSAGFAAASGRAVIPIDGDLQQPELIPALVAKWREGFEMVYAERTSRDDQDWLSRLFSRGFYWLFDRLTDTKLPRDAGDFRLLDRQVVDVLNRMPERNRFMKGIFAWVGFRQAGVPFDAADRHSGRSKMRRGRLFRFALAGLTAFSNFPLRVWGAVGAAISAVAFLYIMVRLIRTLIWGIDIPGYESLIMTILFLGGTQLLTLGIIGDYVGRMFDEVKGRPLYIVRRSLGLETDPEG